MEKPRRNLIGPSPAAIGIALLGAGLGASQFSARGASSAGEPGDFRIVAGACQLRWSAVGDQPGRNLGGVVLALPDINQDGVMDLAVASSRRVVEQQDENLLQLYSGHDGALLREVTLPGSIVAAALVDDLDGDGISEIALGAQLSPLPDCDGGICHSGDHSGVLYIVSPTTGEILLQRPGPDDEPNFGFSPTPYASGIPNTMLVGSIAPTPFPSLGRVHVVSARAAPSLMTWFHRRALRTFLGIARCKRMISTATGFWTCW